MKITSSNNISIEVTPWTDTSSINIKWIQIKEELGGALPVGVIHFWISEKDDALNNVTEERTGTLILRDENRDGKYYEIPFFITSRTYEKNELIIRFSCINNPSFFDTSKIASFTNITEALQTIYPGKKDFRGVISDIDNNTPIFQYNETDQSIYSRLAYSYKYDTVFGYTWRGFLLKDIKGTGSSGNNETEESTLPNIVGGNTGDLTNTEPVLLNFIEELNDETENPWTERQDTPKNLLSLTNFDNYFLCGSNHENLITNYTHNKKLLNHKFYSRYSLTGTIMPNNYEIGDVVIYKRAVDSETVKNSAPFQKCIVYSNEVFIGQGNDIVGPHGFKFEWTSELLGIEKGTWAQNIEK